ncbi:MAG: ParB/RepB/Spo0J family partition protein [Gammaproteobacteria bacterium]|nr:ParB/RepB/Spo0J family partition protein [Gammaproteobacteria bacterium]
MAGNRQHAVDGNAELDRPTPGATWHRTATAPHERHESETSVRQLDVDLLRPGRYQPRRRFTSEALAELAESIRTEGVVQPIIVRPLPDTAPTRYEIIAGERRWRAAQLAGLQHIPALVRSTDDRSTLVQALVENIQREDLNPVEVARGVERLISEFRLTHQEAARRLGRSRDSIMHLLRILKLEPPVLAQVEDGRLSLGHAKLLAGLPQPMQRYLADGAIHKGLSVRALERRIRALDSAPERRSDAHSRRDADIVRLEQRVGEIVGAETRVDYEPERGRGRISFTFHSLEALEGILERLGYIG